MPDVGAEQAVLVHLSSELGLAAEGLLAHPLVSANAEANAMGRRVRRLCRALQSELQTQMGDEASAFLDIIAVRAGGFTFAFPLASVASVDAIGSTDPLRNHADGYEMVVLSEGRTVPVHRLEGAAITPGPSKLLVVLNRIAGQIAVLVDELLPHRSCMLRPLVDICHAPSAASHYAVMGVGEVGLLVTVDNLQVGSVSS